MTTLPLALVAAAGAFGACTAEFEVECPAGTVQTAGGGDVGDACTPVGQGGGGQAGAPGGGAGAAGAPSAGSGGGGGLQPIPDGGVCQPNDTKCEGEAQQTCDAAGQWGAAAACDIACDPAGKACVVPVQLSASNAHVCARLSDSSVRCWGDDSDGQLGNGPGGSSPRPVAVVGLADSASIDLDTDLACSVSASGVGKCWGDFSRLTDAGIEQQTPVALEGVQGVKQLGVGLSFLCALLDGGSLECMGRNSTGALGNDGTTDSTTFAPTAGFPSPPKQLSADNNTACAALTSGAVACWGQGNGPNGSPSGDALLRPTAVANVADVREVIVGGNFSCAIRNDKNVVCWGQNAFGQLGRDSVATGFQVLPPAVMPNFGDVERLSAGTDHACAVKADNSVWCWGNNGSGQLGNTCDALGCLERPEFDPCVTKPARVPLEEPVVDVAVGTRMACALTAGGKVYCWGSNGSGQLGNGTFAPSVPTPTPVRWKLRRSDRAFRHLIRGLGDLTGEQRGRRHAEQPRHPHQTTESRTPLLTKRRGHR